MQAGPASATAKGVVQVHLGEVLPVILDGLADEAEGVRDAALAAGRTAVELYAQVGAADHMRAQCRAPVLMS